MSQKNMLELNNSIEEYDLNSSLLRSQNQKVQKTIKLE